MKPFQIRNIGIFAHVDSGKTTLFERILFELGQISSVGKIEEGTTESDRLKSEIERGISIFSTCLQIPYTFKRKKYKLNFIDTPGHLDFFTQVKDTFSAIDIAILLVDISAGFRSQTEKIYEELKERKIPTILFINKIDKNPNVEEFLIDMQDFFSIKLCPVFVIPKEVPEFILDSKEIFEEVELNFIEWDSKLTEKYFKKPTKKILLQGLESGFLNLKLIPVFAGSAVTGVGVKNLIHFICNIEPPEIKNENLGRFIKNTIHPDLGKLVLLKTNSEIICNKEYYFGETKFSFEKFFEITSNEIFESDFIQKDSVVFARLKKMDINYFGEFSKSKNKSIPKEIYLKHEYLIVLEPLKEDFREKLISGIDKLVWEDSGLNYKIKIDTSQIELYGSGELHLDVAVSRLKEFIGEIFQISNYKVAKYELWKNMTSKVFFEHSAFEGKLKSGILNCFLEKSHDLSNELFWEFNLEEDLKSSVESAVYEILSNGNQGYPILGLKINFLSYESESPTNDLTSSLLKVATISGIKSSLKNNTVFIGPLVHFEIIIPESYYGLVLAILKKRLAKILKVDVTKNNKTLMIGEASAEKMLGFQSALRNMTQGRGFYSSRVFFDKDTFYVY